MKSLRIPRRAFLAGAGGVAVSLPFLEAMLPRKAWAAETAPCRYVATFAGVEQLDCEPSGTGAGYSMPDGFAELEDVRDHIAIVSGLAIEGTGPSGITPPGGKTNPHHGNIMMPLLTGYRSTNDNNGQPHSATADQLVADVYGTDTHYRSLEFRAQPEGYRYGDAGTGSRMSYEADGTPRIPQASPQLAFESLFSGFDPGNGTPDLAAQAALARKLSVLDLVKERGDDLMARVSKYDQVRLEQHFDEIRDLENRLANLPTGGGAGCNKPADPGSDPSATSFPTYDGQTTGYSDEDLRASIFVDLIHMAMVCDLTRVATLMINYEQSGMSLEPLWGSPWEMHSLTHQDDIVDRNEIWNAVTSWQSKFFAQLVAKLAETPEPSGGMMLDNTIVVHTNSGGRTGHGANNLCFAVAGRPSVLRIGEHIRPSGAHPAQLFQTLLYSLGIDTDFGELPGLLPELMV